MDRLRRHVVDFVDRPVDVIVALSSTAALAAKRATTTIPIVFALANDPVGVGLVQNLARPGGNNLLVHLQAENRPTPCLCIPIPKGQRRNRRRRLFPLRCSHAPSSRKESPNRS